MAQLAPPSRTTNISAGNNQILRFENSKNQHAQNYNSWSVVYNTQNTKWFIIHTPKQHTIMLLSGHPDIEEVKSMSIFQKGTHGLNADSRFSLNNNHSTSNVDTSILNKNVSSLEISYGPRELTSVAEWSCTIQLSLVIIIITEWNQPTQDWWWRRCNIHTIYIYINVNIKINKIVFQSKADAFSHTCITWAVTAVLWYWNLKLMKRYLHTAYHNQLCRYSRHSMHSEVKSPNKTDRHNWNWEILKH